jgi:hypothetical protein
MDEITSLLIADMIDEEEEDENEMMVLALEPEPREKFQH